MIYTKRNIKDRVAVGDDCYLIEEVGDGRKRLVPTPDRVEESGTDINKAFLQLMEDRIVWLMNMISLGTAANPISADCATLDGIDYADGVWNPEAGRLEC